MTGDLGSDAERARSRPTFLPPVDGYPPPPEAPATSTGDGAAPAGYPPRRGTPWILAMIVAASALLVAAFLPWARAQVVVDLFGRTLSRDIGSLAGIDADGTVLAVPVLAVVSIALAAWDLIGRDARIGALAAVPGMLALLVCGLFVLRLDDVRDNLPDTGLDLGYQITVRFGWYLAVIASLLVVGFSLARPISERVSGHREAGQPHHPQYAHPDQQYPDQQYPDQYSDQRYSTGEYAAWPSEDQAWGREEHAAHADAAPEPRPDEQPEDQAPGRDAGQS
ncbi:hypothetical protein [Actinomadura madurae]|uniref:hypothetical protein n=2 Tax=Actinomadura madurae TaxID=1993 RepID=UPI0020D21464|nr:hypothetical protein [Actinomadura madurae]MCP9954623.1 hypothetical protein [Actinomadura madurae]MCP9971358.1 hypothetical protein [Actinomadura madurae]MCP9983848.1 hypothetical protein [Actinomadura madurae]